MTRKFTAAIANQLRREILAGKYDHAAFLPSERHLCEFFSAGRGGIRTALRILRDEGLISLIPGRGAAIADGNVSKRVLKRFLVRCNYAPSQVADSLELLGVLAGVCMRAAEIHAEPTVAFSESPRMIDEISEGYRAGTIQGVVFIEDCFSDATASALQTIGIPFLVTNQENDRGVVNCRMNFRMIGRIAGRRLVEAGYASIGMISGNLDVPIYRDMRAGFYGALAEDEIQVAKHHIFEFPIGNKDDFPEMASPESWTALLEMLNSDKRPQAFFTMRDNRAGILYRAAAKCGLSIPTDLAVISYDNLSWGEGKFRGLTTISQPVEEMGRTAVDMLRDWCCLGNPPANHQLEGKLIERTSILPTPPH